MAYATLRCLLSAIALFHLVPSANCTPSPKVLQLLGPQGVNLWKLEATRAADESTGSRASSGGGLLVQDGQGAQILLDTMGFRAQWFRQPLDHFSNDSKHTFHQRYWVNDRHYVPGDGSPVIVLDGGETSGEVCIST
jgi:hypothetical protein